MLSTCMWQETNDGTTSLHICLYHTPPNKNTSMSPHLQNFKFIDSSPYLASDLMYAAKLDACILSSGFMQNISYAIDGAGNQTGCAFTAELRITTHPSQWQLNGTF